MSRSFGLPSYQIAFKRDFNRVHEDEVDHLADSTWSFIEQLLCPSLTSFSFTESTGEGAPGYNDCVSLARFINRHTQINDISLLFGDGVNMHALMDLYLSSDRLTLEHCKFSRITPTALVLPFEFHNKQHKLNTLTVDKKIDEENLRQIVFGCPELTHLGLFFGKDPITEETVKKMLEIQSLKKLCFRNVRVR